MANVQLSFFNLLALIACHATPKINFYHLKCPYFAICEITLYTILLYYRLLCSTTDTSTKIRGILFFSSSLSLTLSLKSTAFLHYRHLSWKRENTNKSEIIIHYLKLFSIFASLLRPPTSCGCVVWVTRHLEWHLLRYYCN